MVTEIPWGDGTSDKIYLTYTAASGSQTILVSSDANAGPARTKDITFVSSMGNISSVLTVMQETNMDYVSITWNDTCITYNDTAIAYPYEEDYIVFADSEVESVLLAAGIGDGVGIKPSHAAAVTNMQALFQNNTDISTFDEFRYFTGITDARDVVGSSSITKITLPPGLVISGNLLYRAFRYCSSLEDIDISDAVRATSALSTDEYLFTNNSSLTTLRVKSIESLIGFMPTTHRNDDTPFYYNSDTHYVYVDGVELTNLVIPNTITEIRPSSFYRFNRVTSVTIPNTVTSIGANAFFGCTGITGNIVLPSTIVSIGQYAFRACAGITDFVWNSSAEFDSSAVYGAGNGTGTFYAAGDVLTGITGGITGFNKIQIDGDVIHNGNRTLGGAPEIRIGGGVIETSSYSGHITKSGGANLKFMEIGGAVELSQGRLIVNNTNLDSAGCIIHFKYNGIACGPSVAGASYTRLTKIYVDSQAVLDQYLANLDWAQYSSKLDLWSNYSGVYKD